MLFTQQTSGKNIRQIGYSLVELVMVIALLSILALTVVAKWPSGMEEQAAVLEFKRAVRYAQHTAMTQQFTGPDKAWGITVAANQYTVQRADGSEFASDAYRNRPLPANTALVGGPVWFNGFGEPIDTAGALLADTIFSIGTTHSMLVHTETGYVE